MMKRLFAIMLLCLSMTGMYGQTTMSFSYMEDKWHEYQQRIRETFFLHQNHFKDTVSVQEMKEAFYKHKNERRPQPSFENRDTVEFLTEVPGIVLKSPLESHPDKKVRECKATWAWHARKPHNPLFRLIDKDGVAQDKLVERLNKTLNEWMDGEFITLRAPRKYMGFTVSPRPSFQIYHKGKQVGGEMVCDMHLGADFFAYAFSKALILGYPDWTSSLGSGIRALGSLHELRVGGISGSEDEKTFSVLLYANPQPQKKSTENIPAYTLELLEPENADEQTMTLFKNFKETIEQIPAKAFQNYYTTDFRIMTGRYYRVTVNKCGWRVEDYMFINK